MSEAVLWRLYRRLLGAHLFEQRLDQSSSRASSRGRRLAGGAAMSAALTENLLESDTLGLAPGDLTTRYLCGVEIEQLRGAAQPRRGKRKSGDWALAVDAEHGLLPGTGEEQASFAIGTALAARLHQSTSTTVLLDGGLPAAAGRKSGPAAAAWEHAARTAIALKLPLLFVTGMSAAWPSGPKRPPAAMPAIPVDRDDALALYRVIYESAARARSGGGPTWVECSPWPLHGDAGNAGAVSALAKMEEALRARKLFDHQQQRQLQNALEKEFALAGWPLENER